MTGPDDNGVRTLSLARPISPSARVVASDAFATSILATLNEAEALRAELAEHQFVEWQATVDRDRALVERDSARAELEFYKKTEKGQLRAEAEALRERLRLAEADRETYRASLLTLSFCPECDEEWPTTADHKADCRVGLAEERRHGITRFEDTEALRGQGAPLARWTWNNGFYRGSEPKFLSEVVAALNGLTGAGAAPQEGE